MAVNNEEYAKSLGWEQKLKGWLSPDRTFYSFLPDLVKRDTKPKKLYGFDNPLNLDEGYWLGKK